MYRCHSAGLRSPMRCDDLGVVGVELDTVRQRVGQIVDEDEKEKWTKH